MALIVSQIVEYLLYFGDGSSECDCLHAILSDAVLDVYVRWHLASGSLACQMPPGATEAQLMSAKNAAFRVPFDVLIAVARYARSHAKIMRCGEGTVSIPDPGGHRAREAYGGLTVSESLCRKAMCYVREMVGSIADHVLVATAYSQALHELGRNCGRNAQPLDDTLRSAILQQCGDLSEPHDVRMATWTIVSPLLMQRTCESLSLLHADLGIEPRKSDGSWYVPGFTKTTDGIAGRVPLWRHCCGCSLAGCCMHEALALPVSQLRAAGCSAGSDGRLSFELACPVCLIWLSRSMQGLGSTASEGANAVYQEIDGETGTFTGRVMDLVLFMKQLREKMDAADAERVAAGSEPFPKEGRSAYMARHGGIMSYLTSGKSVEWVAEMARIPVETVLKYYRRHNVSCLYSHDAARFRLWPTRRILDRHMYARALATDTGRSVREQRAVLSCAGAAGACPGTLRWLSGECSRNELLAQVLQSRFGCGSGDAASAAVLVAGSKDCRRSACA